MSFFDNMAVCILSYKVNFFAEAALRNLCSPVDTYVVHIAKTRDHVEKFVSLPTVQHINFHSYCCYHGNVLSQICFDNPSFVKIFEKYKWIMFFDHDAIIERSDIFWEMVKDNLSQNPEYCIYSCYLEFSTCPFFIVGYWRLKRLAKQKRYEFLDQISFKCSWELGGSSLTKVQHLLFTKEVGKRKDFDTVRILIKLGEQIYHIENFRFSFPHQFQIDALKGLCHITGCWMHNSEIVKKYATYGICNKENEFYINTIELLRINIENNIFRFYNQEDIDLLLSFEGIKFHFKKFDVVLKTLNSSQRAIIKTIAHVDQHL